jgi:hypothetical protein
MACRESLLEDLLRAEEELHHAGSQSEEAAGDLIGFC